MTSVRSIAKGENFLKNHHGVTKEKLDYVVVEDIADPTAFDEVIKSDPPFEAVIHTSSPFHYNVTDLKKDLLDPAIIGTTGILKAIKNNAPTVKRVVSFLSLAFLFRVNSCEKVITSSFAAIVNPANGTSPDVTYSEADWNPVTEEQAQKNPQEGYRASKTFAEKAAWDFVEREQPNFTLATVNPPFVFGPVFSWLQTLENLNTSNQRIEGILTGKARDELPPTGTFVYVDVRDLAIAHVKAAEVPEAGGKWFFITAGYFSNQDIAEVLREAFPDYKDKLPAKGRKGGEFPPEGVYKYDNSRSKTILGLEYRPFKESIVDTAKSLQEIGA